MEIRRNTPHGRKELRGRAAAHQLQPTASQPTIAAIAERARVTRLTVYRHFPDETSPFQACSGHWLSQQQLPQP
ncbi:hypothetical protein [Kitasatospora sp. NPDC093679]|uniref:hypothetical protein n=1 Tax=Kitasatospora sp. NPDC093679 TaxID=3154983 RepID=UPI00341C95AB